ncbi:hypothetical protein GGF32_009776 [Allomyces javanicus]|nr:hypothetical protein GGF32_009776 [Allomyces javanicus]
MGKGCTECDTFHLWTTSRRVTAARYFDDLNELFYAGEEALKKPVRSHNDYRVRLSTYNDLDVEEDEQVVDWPNVREETLARFDFEATFPYLSQWVKSKFRCHCIFMHIHSHAC